MVCSAECNNPASMYKIKNTKFQEGMAFSPAESPSSSFCLYVLLSFSHSLSSTVRSKILSHAKDLKEDSIFKFLIHLEYSNMIMNRL